MNVEWNAHVHLDGTKAKWVGLGWGVPGDRTPTHYEATITVTAPGEANATIGKVGPNETVALQSSADLPWGPDVVVIDVTYTVQPVEGADSGERVVIHIAENAGQKATPTGQILIEKEGSLGVPIRVRAEVPASGG